MRAVLVLILLALPTSASAASVEVLRTSASTFASPALAGNSVVVASYSTNHTIDVLAASPGAVPKRLLHIATPNSSLLPAASGDRVMARVSHENGTTDFYRGSLSAQLSKIESCPYTGSFQAPLSMDGDLSAWVGPGCQGVALMGASPYGQIEIHRGASSLKLAGPPVVDLAVAGRYVAWITDLRGVTGNSPYSVTVNDAETNELVFEAPVSLTPTHLDVQADATVVVGQLDLMGDRRACHGPPSQISYFAAAEPVAHVLPVSSCFPNVKIGAGRIALVQHLADGGDRLVLTDLSGTQVQPVARLDGHPTPIPDFDYDGSRIA